MKKKSKKEKKSFTTPEDSIEIAPELITTVTQLQSFIKKLPKCHTISSRLNATKNLLEIHNNELYQKCIELKGLTILSKWLKEYKVSVADGTELTRDEEIIVTNIICLCENIHLSINDLKTSKIGKNINSLGKALSEDCQVKRHCEEIVAKWRQMIDDNEEAKNETNENNSPSQQNKYRDGGNNFSGKNNNNQYLNNKIKRNSHNSNSFSIASINPNSNIINFNPNVNNTSNKTNSIKIKTYVKKFKFFVFFFFK